MITLDNIRHSFGDITSLDGVSAAIKDGSIYGLIGSNGSGKSTLLRIMCGVYRPDSGAAYFDDWAVYENPDVKNGVLYVSDEPYFLPNATLDSMAAFYARVYRAFDRARYRELASSFGLDTERRLNGFSKGMKKQAAITLALASRPKYLLFDETFDGLDPKMRRRFCGLLAEEAADGVTSVIASHSLRELEDISDHIGLLHRGKLLIDCELDELKNTAHKIQAVFKNQAAPPDLQGALPLPPLGLKWSGSIATFVMRGDEETVRSALEKLHPDFYELIPLTLEEIFISEMEDAGYDQSELAN